MRLVHLTPAIGTEVYGVDLESEPSAALRRELRALWLERQVLIFKQQELTPAELEAAAMQWGEPDRYPFLHGLDGHPHVTEVLKQPEDKVNFGGLWHADTTYQSRPPQATMLYALELPPLGGDTLFANQVLAYQSLSAGLQQTLGTLRATSVAANKAVSATRSAQIGKRGTDESVEDWRAVHPIVRRHPETGHGSLFINPAHTSGIEGWTEAESAPLLAFLFKHQVREAFTCRLRWQVGDVALWDNRAVLHYPLNDYHGHRRRLWRITLKGDTPAALC